MLDTQRPVGDLVLEHSECAAVLRRHRIDFCCKGHVPLAEACADRGLDAAAVAEELEQAISRRAAPLYAGPDPRRMSTMALLAHIVSKHHDYARRSLDLLVPLANKVARVHGEGDPRLVELRRLVEELNLGLRPHLEREEKELFPALAATTSASHLVNGLLGPIEEEHQAVGLLFRRIRDVTDDFALPDWACNSYRTLFRELEALEADTHEHVHLENHVLLPRAAATTRAERGYDPAE